MNLVELSKEISYALRHAPWEYELELDEQGFVILLKINAAAAQKSGVQFYIGNDKVWLCKELPKEFISIVYR